MRSILVTVTLVVGLLLTGASASFAETTTCTGAIGAVQLDNVVVPDNRKCTLNGTRLNGGIVVLTGATLVAKNVHMNGNIQAEGARAVNVTRGSVGGSIQIVQGGSALIDRAQIEGDLQLFDNSGRLQALRNRIGGNLQAVENTGGLIISFNVIEGVLQCKQNAPPPTGGSNQASDKEDQCENL
jgi:hypothetical protein